MIASLAVFALLSVLFVRGLHADEEASQEATVRLSQLGYLCGSSTCVSEEIEATFPFDYFVIEWPEGEEASVRFFENGAWTEWIKTAGENDTPDHSDDARPYQLFMRNRAVRFQVMAGKDTMPEVRATYYTMPRFRNTEYDRVKMALNETPQDLQLALRSDWLDSGIQIKDTTREEKWPTEYDDIKKIIIHHTATTIRDMNNDGSINHDDYREAVRAIYYYHAKSRGWGDIGYQYVIDPDGMIWEGRFGGDGTVGGHAFREKSCKKFGVAGIGFNRGSIGISLLGSYDEADITPQAKDALTSLIAQKSWEFGIDPVGSGFFMDREYPNVIGHRDVDCTNCPGDRLYAYLDAIRTQAQEKYQSYASSRQRTLQAQFIDSSAKAIEIAQGEKKEVRIRYRNTGTVAWRNYGVAALHIAKKDITRSLAMVGELRTAAVDDSERDEKKKTEIAPSQYFAARLLEPNVKPGQIGTFLLTIQDPPTDFIEKREFVLALGSQGWLPSSDFSLEVVNGGLPLAATIVEGDTAQEVTDEGTQKISVRFKNKGTQEWKKGDIRLSLLPVDGEASDISSAAWKHDRGEFSFTEEAVKPGEDATFEFPVKPRKIGAITNLIFLKKGDEHIAGSDRKELSLSVKPSYAAEVLSTTIPSAMLNVWRPTVAVRVKNVGEKAWDAATFSSAAIGKKKSAFADTSWDGASAIDAAQGVEPGSIVTFVFRMKAPRQAGTYREELALHSKDRTIYFLSENGFQESELYSVRVDQGKK